MPSRGHGPACLRLQVKSCSAKALHRDLRNGISPVVQGRSNNAIDCTEGTNSMDAGMNMHIALGLVILVAFLRIATGWPRNVRAVLIVAFTPRILSRRVVDAGAVSRGTNATQGEKDIIGGYQHRNQAEKMSPASSGDESREVTRL